jgi:outer membrane receptor protein involved in Fe transport
LLAALACSNAAMAQTVPMADPPGEHDADAAAVSLEAVTVTAGKVGRSLKDTAASIVVLDAQALDERGLHDSNEVLAHIPNVTSAGQSNLAPAVRGIDGTGSAQGADAFFAGSRARLSVQVDGRPASYNEVVFGNASLWDVRQVEMLRGPHSTLQGRNAMAGTLAIQTRDPTWAPESAVRMMAGSHGRGQAAFFVSGPLSDEVAGRLSGDYQAHHSEVDFRSYAGVEDPGQYTMRTLRGKLLFEPAALPELRELLTLQHTDSRGPQSATQARPFGAHQAAFPPMPVFVPASDSLISDTRWDLSDRMTFENLLTATGLTIQRHAQPHTGRARIDNHQYMLEPRIRLERGDGDLSGVAGVHLYRTLQRESIDFPVDESFADRADAYALYGESSLALGRELELTFGARYQYERHRRHGGDGALVRIAIDETDRVFLPKLGLAWHPEAKWTLGVLAARGYNGGGGGITYGAPIVNYHYKSEHVRNYEAYFRADLMDGRISWTGNVFYADYRDLQLPFDLNPDPAVWSVVVRNAPRAHSYGLESAVHWQVARGLEVRASLGLLRTNVTDYPGSGVQGYEFARAPAASGALGLHWQGRHGFDVGLDARYSDGYWSTIEHHPRGHTDPYWLVNARAGYRTGGLYTFVFIKNVLDEDTPLLLDTGASRADDGALLPETRHFGIGIQWNFSA